MHTCVVHRAVSRRRQSYSNDGNGNGAQSLSYEIEREPLIANDSIKSFRRPMTFVVNTIKSLATIPTDEQVNIKRIRYCVARLPALSRAEFAVITLLVSIRRKLFQIV